ncbi:hypothetical protein WA588_005251, partial [Blastocystis sp. NMH]
AVVQFLPVNSDALVSALNLLILLCRDDEARKRLYTCDCVVTLRKLLYLPNTPIDTQELCLSLLSRLSALKFCRQVILDNGLLPVIVSLIQKNLEDPGMVLCGLACLNYLAYHNYAVCKKLCEGNNFSLIILCCVSYVEKKDIGIVTQSLGVISCILAMSVKDQDKDKSLIIPLLANDIVPLLDKMIVIFLRSPKIMFQCVSSIHMLSLNEEGLTYLKNVDGLIDHLMAVLDTPTNLEATKR